PAPAARPVQPNRSQPQTPATPPKPQVQTQPPPQQQQTQPAPQQQQARPAPRSPETETPHRCRPAAHIPLHPARSARPSANESSAAGLDCSASLLPTHSPEPPPWKIDPAASVGTRPDTSPSPDGSCSYRNRRSTRPVRSARCSRLRPAPESVPPESAALA